MEHMIIAVIAKYPKLKELLKEIELSDYAKRVSRIVFNMDSTEPIAHTLFVSKMDGSYEASYFSKIYKFQEDPDFPKTEESAKSFLNNMFKILHADNMKKKAINDLQEAIKYIDAEMYDHAQKKLLEVKLVSNTSNSLSELLYNIKNKDNVIRTGIISIDNMMGGMPRGQLIGFTGFTGAIKTGFTLWLTLKILENNSHVHIKYFEKEMPEQDIALRIACYYLNISMSDLMLSDKYQLFLKEADLLIEAANLNNRFQIIGNQKFNTAFDISNIIKSSQTDVYVLDFLTQLDVGKDMNSNAIVSVNALKQGTNNINGVGLIINQVKKTSIEQRSNKIPVETDAEWSGTAGQLYGYHFGLFNPNRHYPHKNPVSDIISDNYKKYFFMTSFKMRYSKDYKVIPFLNENAINFKEPSPLIQNEMIDWWSRYNNIYR